MLCEGAHDRSALFAPHDLEMGLTTEGPKLLVGNVPIDNGIVGHACAQTTAERLEGWLDDTLQELRQT